jgi:hypothetical protein
VPVLGIIGNYGIRLVSGSDVVGCLSMLLKPAGLLKPLLLRSATIRSLECFFGGIPHIIPVKCTNDGQGTSPPVRSAHPHKACVGFHISLRHEVKRIDIETSITKLAVVLLDYFPLNEVLMNSCLDELWPSANGRIPCIRQLLTSISIPISIPTAEIYRFLYISQCVHAHIYTFSGRYFCHHCNNSRRKTAEA